MTARLLGVLGGVATLALANNPAWAKDINADVNISAVTVFPASALITRNGKAEIPQGNHNLIITGLDDKLDPNSVRMVLGEKDENIQVTGIDVRRVVVPQTGHKDKVRQLKGEITALEDQINALDQAMRDADRQRVLTEALLKAGVAPGGSGEGRGPVTPAQVLALLDAAQTRFAALAKIKADARVKRRDLSRELERKRRELDLLGSTQKSKQTAIVRIRAGQAAKISFGLSYLVGGAGWTPVYDARLTIGDDPKAAKVELIRRAVVRQKTGSAWTNVKLSLSTTRPTNRTAPPRLRTYELRIRQRRQLRKRLNSVSNQQRKFSPQAQLAEAPAPRKVQAVRVLRAPFQAVFQINEPVSIDNNGTTKSVRIQANTTDARIVARIVPRRIKAAFIMARFKVPGGTPTIPGPVYLWRDGIYVGRGGLKHLQPGVEHGMGFGRDDFIRVTRNKLATKDGESGLLSTSRTATRKFETIVENLHSFALPVTMLDVLPYAVDEQITVDLLSDTTRPDKKNFEKVRGQQAWQFRLNGGEKQVIRFGYRVSWPDKTNITPVR